MPDYIGLDFETFGEVNLPKYGLHRYITGKGFQPLIASISDGKTQPKTFDFVRHGQAARKAFSDELEMCLGWGYQYIAHNVGFERAVLRQMGISDRTLWTLHDSAVIARCNGAASKLEAAAPQLTGIDKLDTGWELIKLFSIPNDQNGGSPFSWHEIRSDTVLMEKWQQFKDYCEVDAEGSRAIGERYRGSYSSDLEFMNEQFTAEMNNNGWYVDMALVDEMHARYQANVQQALEDFAQQVDPYLNLNSVPQLKAWCQERGIKTTSFDQDHVAALLEKLSRALPKIPVTDKRYNGYVQVRDMLVTKKILGGSSLAKLQKIRDLTSEDGRLRDQYLHCGAGQTYRTSGKGVQLQNLKRLGSDVMDMDDVYDESLEIDNETMAQNLRQVFKAQDPNGFLIVGDFGSVESRGLAWLAGEQYKIDAYRQGKDIYKVLAAMFKNIAYEDVTKEARAEGKYSELSCGYQAGPQAVKDFMHKLGFEVPLDGEGGAVERVDDWRKANPRIVVLWATIDEALNEAVDSCTPAYRQLANDLALCMRPIETPTSLLAQHPGAQSLAMELRDARTGALILERTFHGCYRRGRQICYYKPSELKGGQLWRGHYRHPKTKQITFYSIYGGKLSGILTQSLCRELFFYSLGKLSGSLSYNDNTMLIGQFHDEIVVEWKPSNSPASVTLEDTEELMVRAMTSVPSWAVGFPLTVEVKHDYRYTK